MELSNYLSTILVKLCYPSNERNFYKKKKKINCEGKCQSLICYVKSPRESTGTGMKMFFNIKNEILN